VLCDSEAGASDCKHAVVSGAECEGIVCCVIQEQEPLTANMLSSVSVQEQKQMLGERLFPLIQAMHRDLAGKITGMLLEIDNSELIHMLESGESLRAKVTASLYTASHSSCRIDPICFLARWHNAQCCHMGTAGYILCQNRLSCHL